MALIDTGNLQSLPEQARCAGCGYSLHALTTNRCPECGQAFDRAAVLALLSGNPAKLPFDATAAIWLSPPPWWATGLALLAVVTDAAAQSIMPIKDRDPSCFGIIVFATALATFLLRGLDHLKACLRYDLNGTPKRRIGVNWILLPIACFIASPPFIGVVGQECCMRFAFTASEIQMTRLAKQVLASRSSPPDQWVGFYHAAYICPASDGMNFRLADHHDYGFAFTTTGQPPACRPYAEWMGGGWYEFGDP